MIRRSKHRFLGIAPLSLQSLRAWLGLEVVLFGAALHDTDKIRFPAFRFGVFVIFGQFAGRLNAIRARVMFHGARGLVVRR